MSTNSCSSTPKETLEKKLKLTTFMKNTNELAVLTPISSSEQLNRSKQSIDLSDTDFNVTIEKLIAPVEKVQHDPLVHPGNPDNGSRDSEKESSNKSPASTDDHDTVLTNYEAMVKNINLFNSMDLKMYSRNSSLSDAMKQFVVSKGKGSVGRNLNDCKLNSSPIETRVYNAPVKIASVQSLLTYPSHKSEATSNVNEVEACHKTASETKTCRNAQMTSNVSETISSHESSTPSDARSDSLAVLSVCKNEKNKSVSPDNAEIDRTQTTFPSHSTLRTGAAGMNTGKIASGTPNITESSANMFAQTEIEIVEPSIGKTYGGSKLTLNIHDSQKPIQGDVNSGTSIQTGNIQKTSNITKITSTHNGTTTLPEVLGRINTPDLVDLEETSHSPASANNTLVSIRVVPNPDNTSSPPCLLTEHSLPGNENNSSETCEASSRTVCSILPMLDSSCSPAANVANTLPPSTIGASIQPANIVDMANVVSIVPVTVVNAQNVSSANNNNLAPISIVNISSVESPEVGEMNRVRPKRSSRSNVSIITPPPVGKKTNETTRYAANNCQFVRIAPKTSESNSSASSPLIRIAPKTSESNSSASSPLTRIAPKQGEASLPSSDRTSTRTASNSKLLNTSGWFPVRDLLRSFPAYLKVQLNTMMSEHTNPAACVQDLRDCLSRLSTCVRKSEELTSALKVRGLILLEDAQSKIDCGGDCGGKAGRLSYEVAYSFTSSLMEFFQVFYVHTNMDDSSPTVGVLLNHLIVQLSFLKVTSSKKSITEFRILLHSLSKNLVHQKSSTELKKTRVEDVINRMLSILNSVEDCQNRFKINLLKDHLATLISILKDKGSTGTHCVELVKKLMNLKMLGKLLLESRASDEDIGNFVKQLANFRVMHENKLTLSQNVSSKSILDKLESNVHDQTFLQTILPRMLTKFFKLFDMESMQDHGGSNDNSMEPNSSNPVNIRKPPPPLIKISSNRSTVSIPSPGEESGVASLSLINNESHNVDIKSEYNVASVSPVGVSLSANSSGIFSPIVTNRFPNNESGYATISPCKNSTFSELVNGYNLSRNTEDADPLNPLVLDVHSEEEEEDKTDNEPLIDNDFSPVISSVRSLTENGSDLVPAVENLSNQTTLVITNEGYRTVPTKALNKSGTQEQLNTQMETRSAQNYCSSEFISLKTESQVLFSTGIEQPSTNSLRTYLDKLHKFIVNNPKEVTGFQKTYGECLINDIVLNGPLKCVTVNEPVEFETGTRIKSDLRAFFKNNFDDHAFTYFQASMGFSLEMCIICLEMRKKKKMLFLKFLNHFVVDHVESFPYSEKCEYYNRIEITLDKMKRTFRYMRTFGNCLMSFNIQKLIQENKESALKLDELNNTKGKKGNYKKRDPAKHMGTLNKSKDLVKLKESNDNQTLLLKTVVNNEKSKGKNTKKVQNQPQASETIQGNNGDLASRKEKITPTSGGLKEERLKRRKELNKIVKKMKKNKVSQLKQEKARVEKSRARKSRVLNNDNIIVRNTANSMTKVFNSQTDSLDNEPKIKNRSTEWIITKENNNDVDNAPEMFSVKHEVRDVPSNSEICDTSKFFSVTVPIKQVKDEVESIDIAVKEECNSPEENVDHSDNDRYGDNDGDCSLKIYEEIDLISVHDSDADTPDELDEETDVFVDGIDEAIDLNYSKKSQEKELIRVQGIKDEVVEKIQKDSDSTTRLKRKVRKRRRDPNDEESDEDGDLKKKMKPNPKKKINREVDKRIMDILAGARIEMELEEKRRKEIEQLKIICKPSKTYENKRKTNKDDDNSVKIPSKSYEKKPQKAIKTYSKKEPVSNILYSAYVSMIRMVTLNKEPVSYSEICDIHKSSSINSVLKQEQSIKLFEYFDDEFSEKIFDADFGVESNSLNGIDLCTDQYDAAHFTTLETEPLLTDKTYGEFPKVSDESCIANMDTSQLFADVFVKTEIEDLSQSSFARIGGTLEQIATVEKIASDFDEMFDPSARYDSSYCQIVRVTKRKSVESSPADSNCGNRNVRVKYPDFNKMREVEPKTANPENITFRDKHNEINENEVTERKIKEEIEDSCHVKPQQTPTEFQIMRVLKSETLYEDNAEVSNTNNLVEVEINEETCHLTRNQNLAEEKTSNRGVSSHNIECEQNTFNIIKEEFEENSEMSVDEFKIESDTLIDKNEVLEVVGTEFNKFNENNDCSFFFTNDDDDPIMIDVTEDEPLINATDINTKNKVPKENETLSKPQIASSMKLTVTKESFARIYTFVVRYSSLGSLDNPSVGHFVGVFQTNKANTQADALILEVILNEVTNKGKDMTENMFVRAKSFLESNLDIGKSCDHIKRPYRKPESRKMTKRKIKEIQRELDLTEREYQSMVMCKVALDPLTTDFIEQNSIQVSIESYSVLMQSQNQRKSKLLANKIMKDVLKDLAD